MASETLPQDNVTPEESPAVEAHRQFVGSGRELRVPQLVRQALKPLASMKLTVVLFALSVFLVFTGTLVQTRVGIWDVMETYFKSWFAWIEFKIFFPPAWVPGLVSKEWQPFFMDFPGKKFPLQGFYFPGGLLIGTLMAINLAAAHLLRFTFQAKGRRLYAGWGVIALGCVVTYLVIVGGSNPNGVQGEPFFSWGMLWWLMKFGLASLSLTGAYCASRLPDDRKLERLLLQSGSVVLGLVTAWLFYENNAVKLGDDSMRILWQLIQATLAGVVLLAGCILAFNKRAGIVLIHAGVGLMMFAELLVTVRAKESQMYIVEGDTENHSVDTRTPELAVIEVSYSTGDRVTAIPENFLHEGNSIQHADLPFDIEVLKYFPNASVRDLKPGEKTLATSGSGLSHTVDAKPLVNGVDTGGEFDHPAAFVKLKQKGSNEVLGTYLTAVSLHPRLEFPESVTVAGKTYQMLLRFQHIYRPYTIRLNEFRHDKYPGTEVAKDFTSQVTVIDPEKDEEREARIWMNNPLRYRGETFYQQEYGFDPITQKKMTILQVVTNTGWMIPYVSCMLVVVGMLYHFSLTLLRFLRRRSEQAKLASMQPAATRIKGAGRRGFELATSTESGWSSWAAPAAVTAILALWLVSVARIPTHKPDTFNFEKFGRIPVVSAGRLKPIDALARSSLRVITDREEVKLGEGKDAKKISATEWLLDVMANPKAAAEHKVFRIDDQRVIDLFGLKRIKELRYSLKEMFPKFAEFRKEMATASELSMNEQDSYQRRIMELARRISIVDRLNNAFLPPDSLPHIPTEEEITNDPAKARADLQFLMQSVEADKRELDKQEPPRVVPAAKDENPDAPKSPNATGFENWQAYSTAFTKSLILVKIGAKPDENTVSWAGMLTSYREGKVEEFNKQVDTYLERLGDHPPQGLNQARVNFEAFFNHFAPFYHLCVLYVIAFVFTVMAWLCLPQFCNRTALLLAILGIVVHTWAICARMYISGRPPVTNLYTTAIFIGWGAILLGIAFELIFKKGIGNLIASLAGYVTLFIAHGLASEGNADTFGILVAVLDTQFWLATHVVTINLGYATTFVSGCLGCVYILRGVLTPSLRPDVGKDIIRMTYGTLCFGMLFSFFGTVLGGLWGDVSWGRFWGWDPKENGALLIVLWTALILHARWDGWVKDRGFAVLAVGGNIWTAWSWFGVNQLGVGLHAYGKTDGTLEKLALFFASQFLIICLGLMPKSAWWSNHENAANANKWATPKTTA